MNASSYGRISEAHVRQVGPQTFEARDPSGEFSAVDGTAKGAVSKLAASLPAHRKITGIQLKRVDIRLP